MKLQRTGKRVRNQSYKAILLGLETKPLHPGVEEGVEWKCDHHKDCFIILYLFHRLLWWPVWMVVHVQYYSPQ